MTAEDECGAVPGLQVHERGVDEHRAIAKESESQVVLGQAGPLATHPPPPSNPACYWSGVHRSLRVTPAMEAGVSDHVWSLEEIARLA